jgi:hypothetical protein
MRRNSHRATDRPITSDHLSCVRTACGGGPARPGNVDKWREEEIAARAENRRQAAYGAKLTRSLKKAAKKPEMLESQTDAAAAGAEVCLSLSGTAPSAAL